MIKLTRNFALALVLLTILFSSCKKEAATDSKYYVKFKKNGTWITWTYALSELGPDLVDEADAKNQRIQLLSPKSPMIPLVAISLAII